MNRITFAWVLLIGSLAGMVLCLALFLTDTISDRVQLAVTLALSWLALTLTALDALWTATVRDEVEDD